MNQAAHDKIISLLNDAGVRFDEFEHPECRTSEESQKVREAAGFPGTIGAKCLLAKLYLHDGEEIFAAIVLPGIHQLNKEKLFKAVGAKKMRFATVEELAQLAGVVPGCMPPFGTQVFPDIQMTIVASALKDFPQIGFNIASLTRSVVMQSKDYFSVVTSDFKIDISEPKA
jgi:prolyl-tRNA editing enzyme YbaK/EbsC (Cys-tRNA(Pro) deacylase)